MKNCYCLVGVLAVVCTVWNGAESQDCINIEEMKECISTLQDLAQKGGIFYASTKDKLDIWCRGMNKGLQCPDNYAQRCLTEETRHNYLRLYNGTSHLVNKLCQPGPYQDELLTKGQCLAQVKGDVDHCDRKFIQHISEFAANMGKQNWKPPNEMSPENDSKRLAYCCSFRDFKVCTHGIVMEQCGEQPATFFDDVISHMSPPIMQERCRSDDQCPVSSAHRNSRSAQLFPNSIAMTVLYAVHPTRD